MQVICPRCNKEAPWVENKEKYGRNFGKSYMCYFCKPCGTYVGCHNNTRNPLGTMTDKYGLDMRRKAHYYFDAIWKRKNARFTRKQAYQLLRDKFGKEVHIGESNPEMCKEIISLVNNLST